MFDRFKINKVKSMKKCLISFKSLSINWYITEQENDDKASCLRWAYEIKHQQQIQCKIVHFLQHLNNHNNKFIVGFFLFVGDISLNLCIRLQIICNKTSIQRNNRHKSGNYWGKKWCSIKRPVLLNCSFSQIF